MPKPHPTAAPAALYGSIAEAAAMIAVSTDTMRDLVSRGEIPAVDVAVSRGKRRWRIAYADLQAWLDRRRNVPPQPQPRQNRRTAFKRKYY